MSKLKVFCIKGIYISATSYYKAKKEYDLYSKIEDWDAINNELSSKKL